MAERDGKESMFNRTTVVVFNVLLFAAIGGAYAIFGSISSALAYARGERLLVDDTRKSFGVLDAGQSREVAFRLSNRSGRTVRVLGMKSNCTCATSGGYPMTIQPGESVALKVNVNTKKLSGEVAQPIRFYTDYPKRLEIELVVHGFVTGGRGAEVESLNDGNAPVATGGD
jgi:hypothetical protein